MSRYLIITDTNYNPVEWDYLYNVKFTNIRDSYLFDLTDAGYQYMISEIENININYDGNSIVELPLKFAVIEDDYNIITKCEIGEKY